MIKLMNKLCDVVSWFLQVPLVLALTIVALPFVLLKQAWKQHRSK